MKLLSANADNQFSRASTSGDMVVPVLYPKSGRPRNKPTDLMDAWLEDEGFYRKHIARDASSLFRCVSEVVFLTQVHHLSVRRHCIQFALYQTDIFKTLTNVPVKDYVERLSNPREWGTPLDMEVMSRLYGLEFAVYKDIKRPLEKITNNGFQYSIILSMSFEHHYDSVYPKQHIMHAAFCQSILYEIIYKHVFKLEEVDYAVNRMLRDKSGQYQPDFSVALNYHTLELRDNCRNVKELLNCGITPFPYRVAKALDPTIYRNVEYDTWHEQKKALRHSSSAWNDKELKEGSKCWVNFHENNQTIKRRGHIQKMSPNKGPVVAFVEEIGEILTVPFESLELFRTEAENDNEIDDEDFSRAFTRLAVKDDKSADKRTNNVDSNSSRRAPTVETKDQYRSAGSIPELCSVHYAHPTTTVVPSTCYACITSQTFHSEVNSNLKTTQVALPTNGFHERSKGNQEFATIDQTTSLSMQYTLPMYPIVQPDLSVPPTVTPSLLPSKTLNPNESCIGTLNPRLKKNARALVGKSTNTKNNSSSVRVMYNRSMDSYYRYGYSTYPYYVVPSNMVYSNMPSENSVQQNVDTTRMHYSYPYSQVSNEMMYALPAPGSNAKTELPMYPTTPLVHPANTLSVKNSITMTGSAPASPMPSTYPAVSSSVCSVPYSPYTQPVYYHPYDYYYPCSDLQGCENVTQSYPIQSYMPVAYPEEAYSPNAQVYCQSL